MFRLIECLSPCLDINFTIFMKKREEEMGLEVGDVMAWDTVSEKGKKYARLRKLE